jgi:hypothetical protein
MSKKRILVLPSDRTGVGKFRSVQPHTYLQQQYPDEFHIDIMYDISIDDLNFFKNYDIVSFHRSLNTNYEKSRKVQESPAKSPESQHFAWKYFIL